MHLYLYIYVQYVCYNSNKGQLLFIKARVLLAPMNMCN